MCMLKVIFLALLFSIRLRFPLDKSITYALRYRYGNLVVKELQKFEKVDYSSLKCQLDLTFLIITYLWSWFGKDVKQDRAFNCPTTFFQIVEICDSIFICLSISILYWTLWLFSKFLISSCISLEKAEMVLDLIWNLAAIQSNSLKMLYLLLILTRCLRGWQLCKVRSWGMQPKALERSISTAPTKFLLFNALFHCSINLKRTSFVLYVFLYADIDSVESYLKKDL